MEDVSRQTYNYSYLKCTLIKSTYDKNGSNFVNEPKINYILKSGSTDESIS